jgi:hypothetical protein
MNAQEWMDLALSNIRALAHTRESFTTDEVWMRLGDMTPKEPRLMGVAMRTAESLGYIGPTDQYYASARPVCHGRPVRVWRSCLWNFGNFGSRAA